MRSFTRAAYATLSLAYLASAHGDDESMDMGMTTDMDMHGSSSAAVSTGYVSQSTQSEGQTSYFAYGQHTNTISAHIALMTSGWCFILPAAVMLSISRSRLALPSQFVFLVFNTLGSLFGITYNNQTPDSYENNVHHKIGWIVTWVSVAQIISALVFCYAGRGESKHSLSRSCACAAFLPVATDERECRFPTGANRWSRHTGQDTEPDCFVSSSSSSSSGLPAEYYSFEQTEELPSKPSGPRDWFQSSIVGRFLSSRVPGMVPNRVLRIFNGVYNSIDRIILPFGFVAIATGAVTYGGIFHGIEIFNGSAHFIKGGIFFWYGIITLGRFMGAWADSGWAWNKKPPSSVVGWKAKVPLGEFVESFVIWLYGVINVFLEHSAGSGKEWTARDMEHVSISIMFFGGGLVGMLFESRRILEALNSTSLQSPTQESDNGNWQPPKSQGVSLNPMPALVILLSGMMMGSHHQDSMTSTMVHKQWGNMLIGFAIARTMTYVLLYLRPPTSYLPARPPTEIVAGFCLISGGLIFMLSTRQVIEAMEFYESDAMFTFTVGMGFTAFIMSLVVLNIAIKAWAVKRERA